jgi:hypothetical protein
MEMKQPIILSQPIHLNKIPGFKELIANETNEANVLKATEVTCSITNEKYRIICYDKNFLNVDSISTSGLCRSMVVNKENKVVCFSPPKSIRSEDFIRKYPVSEEIIAMEFVEGTMINVFWDKNINGWELSTRHTIGATSKFYKSEPQYTFRDMFWEAAKENNLDMKQLNPDFCYSFVVQHPLNRIVVPFKKPQLYLVACYTIVHEDEDKEDEDTEDEVNIMIYPHSTMSIRHHDWSGTGIKFPEIYSFNNYTELIHKYASMNTSYNILGVVLYNKCTGERCKIRNPVYEQIRSLRGNQPKLQYQYLCLRKEGKVSDFLTYYPEHKKDLSNFRDQIHLFTQTLYSNYVSCYIKKEKPLNEFSAQFRTHMFNIHRLYMTQLKDQNLFVMNTTVIKYVNELHPSLLMHSLNYNMKKRSVDFVKTVEIV